MRILVTGSSGQIGTNLCQRLLREGHDVFGIDNAGDTVRTIEPVFVVTTVPGPSITITPERFVIGGGVAQLGEDLLGPVRIAYETSLPGYGDRPIAEFAIAELGNDAGLIGAADLAIVARPPESARAGSA